MPRRTRTRARSSPRLQPPPPGWARHQKMSWSSSPAQPPRSPAAGRSPRPATSHPDPHSLPAPAPLLSIPRCFLQCRHPVSQGRDLRPLRLHDGGERRDLRPLRLHERRRRVGYQPLLPQPGHPVLPDHVLRLVLGNSRSQAALGGGGDGGLHVKGRWGLVNGVRARLVVVLGGRRQPVRTLFIELRWIVLQFHQLRVSRSFLSSNQR